jgi:hypothetical protein
MGHSGVMPSLSSLPTPVRAALGLAATVLDEAKRLPDKAIELPMLAVSRALKLSLRAQQQYTALAARGDELLSGRSIGDEPPEWARFDEVEEPVVITPPPVDDAPARPATRARAPRPAKTVRAPRTGTPSKFDAVDDD